MQLRGVSLGARPLHVLQGEMFGNIALMHRLGLVEAMKTGYPGMSHVSILFPSKRQTFVDSGCGDGCGRSGWQLLRFSCDDFGDLLYKCVAINIYSAEFNNDIEDSTSAPNGPDIEVIVVPTPIGSFSGIWFAWIRPPDHILAASNISS